jgi:hypothetical protein
MPRDEGRRVKYQTAASGALRLFHQLTDITREAAYATFGVSWLQYQQIRTGPNLAPMLSGRGIEIRFYYGRRDRCPDFAPLLVCCRPWSSQAGGLESIAQNGRRLTCVVQWGLSSLRLP